MPSRRVHLKFDRYLIEHGVVSDRSYNTVHNRMDKNLHRWGHWYHRDLDDYHKEEGMREWLRKWCHLAYQETLTDYLRVALGHLVLDEMWSEYEYDSEYELMKSAYRSFYLRFLEGGQRYQQHSSSLK